MSLLNQGLFTISENSPMNLSLQYEKLRIISKHPKYHKIKSKVYRRWSRTQRKELNKNGRQAERAYCRKIIEKRARTRRKELNKKGRYVNRTRRKKVVMLMYRNKTKSRQNFYRLSDFVPNNYLGY